MSILIISDRESDLSNILMRSAPCRLINLKMAEREDLSHYSAIALLCGTENARPMPQNSC